MKNLIKYSLICLFLAVFAEINSYAQTEGKYELRATWVASVANIDWPQYEDRGKPEDQKADLIAKLDLYESVNLNAIFLQVRPECDAFYNSAYEPWSRYLSWTQGDYPGYDPLQFAIDEAHKRGIEVHAWMNPYRASASTSPGADYFHPTHVYKEHPEWTMTYASGRILLNPGLPEVMSYIGAVVNDLCSNYDIDGVHFDDYFYAYEGTDVALDADEYALYNNGMSLSDWRRDNINRMIDTVYSNIQKANPNIRFGVSPFGIYRPGTPPGIIGMDAYNQIYCDPLAWLEDQTVDYLTPQLYWPTGGGQDFESLANWWADQCNTYGRHLYTGHGSYRLSADPGLKKSVSYSDLHENKNYFDLYINNSGELSDLSLLEQNLKKGTSDPVSAWTLSELGRQINIVRARQLESGLGGVYFSAKDFSRVQGMADYLALNFYTHPAIIPDMTWKVGAIPDAPQNLRSEKSGGNYYLKWDYTGNTNDRFVIYISEEETNANQIISNPDNIKTICFEDSIAFYDLEFSTGSSIVVTSVSAKGTESLASSVYKLDVDLPTVSLVSPENNAVISQNTSLNWLGSEPGSTFKLQVSENSNFSLISYQSNWIPESQINVSVMDLDGETEYFWRVRSQTDMDGPWSETKKFSTGFPAMPTLLSPKNLDQNISTKPRIKWTSSASSTWIDVEISGSSDFSSLIGEESFTASEGQGIMTTPLEKETWYYARIKSRNDFGESHYTDFVAFKTTAGEIPEVNLLQPLNQAMVASFDLFKWETTVSTGTLSYLMDIAFDSDFSVIVSSSGWINESEILASIMNLEGQRNYFWRVKAKSEYGEGDYSEVREYTAAYPPRPTIGSPVHLSEGNPVMTELIWTAGANTDSMYFEFSEDGNFNSLVYSESFIALPNANTIQISLHEYTWYFLRAAAKNDYGYSIFSFSKYFKTGISNDISLVKPYAEKVKVFPNPANGEFVRIQVIGEDSKNLNCTLYDSYGKTIGSFTNFQLNSDRSSSIIIYKNEIGPEGLYFIKVSNGEFVEVKPIIIIE
ncbi:MAG: family 10 glycosylhydrolase [Bacteroidales bacterium]|nr:family 10 glycosylhydrolase [Bacteroidales bacterium]